MQEELEEEEEEELRQALFSFQLLIICIVSPSYLRSDFPFWRDVMSGIQQSPSNRHHSRAFLRKWLVCLQPIRSRFSLPACTGRRDRAETSPSGCLCLLLRVGWGIKTALRSCHFISISTEAFKQLFDGTCRPGWLAVALDTVDLVGLRDVQLVAVRDLLEIGAFVERAPEPGLPHGGVSFVPPLPVLAFVHSPGLSKGRRSRV